MVLHVRDLSGPNTRLRKITDYMYIDALLDDKTWFNAIYRTYD